NRPIFSKSRSPGGTRTTVGVRATSPMTRGPVMPWGRGTLHPLVDQRDREATAVVQPGRPADAAEHVHREVAEAERVRRGPADPAPGRRADEGEEVAQAHLEIE